MSFQHFANISQ